MTDAILPHALPSALEGRPGLRVLSLDCFDTLLWRDCHAPTDLFARLPGATTLQRRVGEDAARRAAGFGRDRKDVTIAEIYAEMMPQAAPAAVEAAIAEELAAEAAHCYAFTPTVQLMRKAKAQGLDIVIVSDTYLDAAQLRDLIARAAGDAVAALIDRVFCSSAYGRGKALGLYEDVLRELRVAPQQILHIGDNRRADVEGVAPFGVQTLHLAQFSPVAEQRFRQEAAVSALLHLRPDAQAAAQLPHRAALALAEPQVTDPAEALGLTVLGPVLHGFERWLDAEAAALQAQRPGKVHWLFVMRDGYLPKLVHEAAGGTGHAIDISRFTATAASFRDEAAPLHFVERNLGLKPQTIARQLLMPEPEIAQLMDGLTSSQASYALLGEVRKQSRREATVTASREAARRLVAHVRATVDPAPGDTLMLIDLGYNGTVQNLVEGLLREELGVHVAGRYLMLCEMQCAGLDKRGLIDVERYDEPTLEAILSNVTLLEQVCTTAIGSIVGYDEDGTPIREAADLKGAQSAVRTRIQAGVIRFGEAEREAAIRVDDSAAVDRWRKGAAAALVRIMFLPFAHELAVIQEFQHDANMGSGRTVPLFKPEVAQQGLRQRGLFYLNGTERLYLPAELTGQGLAPKLALLANRRFGLPFQFADFVDTSLTLPVIYAVGDQMVHKTIEARPTHEGYYLAAVPIGDCRFTVALQFGADYEYVQIDSVMAAPVETFLDDCLREETRQIPLAATPEGMEQLTPDLYRATGDGGFLLIHPPERVDDTPMLVAVVFRPIAAWPHAAADTGAAPLGVAA